MMAASSLLRKRNGFSLAEIIIAVIITGIIVSGLSAFLMKVSISIANSQSKTKTVLALSDFTEELWNLRRQFPNSKVLRDDGGYDVILFSNSGGTAWALVWVVVTNKKSQLYKYLDTTDRFHKYGSKSLFIQNISSTDITNINLSAGSANNFLNAFQVGDESIYYDLLPKAFDAVLYQSWALMEITLEVYNGFDDAFAGKNTRDLPFLDQVRRYVIDI